MNKNRYYLGVALALAISTVIYVWYNADQNQVIEDIETPTTTPQVAPLHSRTKMEETKQQSPDSPEMEILSENNTENVIRPTIETANGLVYRDFVVQPFPVFLETDHYQWTADDGMQPSALDALAHNDLERKRLKINNKTISRRQLIYQKNSFLKQATAETPLSTMTLPGFDGSEFEINVTETTLNQPEEEMEGIIKGHVNGYPNSTVTIAFNDEVATGYLSIPEKNIYIEYDPREANQLVLKAMKKDD